MIEFLNYKKATNEKILAFLAEHGSVPIIACSDTEIGVWIKVRKEAHKRKIGPFSLNVQEARSWKV